MIGSAHHRLLAARHVFIRERKVINEKCAANDYGRRKYDACEDSSVDDWLVLLPRWLTHHCVINGINAERLAWRACGEKT